MTDRHRTSSCTRYARGVLLLSLPTMASVGPPSAGAAARSAARACAVLRAGAPAPPGGILGAAVPRPFAPQSVSGSVVPRANLGEGARCPTGHSPVALHSPGHLPHDACIRESASDTLDCAFVHVRRRLLPRAGVCHLRELRAIRADGRRSDGGRVRRQPVRVRVHPHAHAVARDARQLDVHAHPHAAAVRPAVPGERRRPGVPRVRRTAHDSQARLRTRRRDDDARRRHGHVHGGSRRPRGRPCRSRSATPTSCRARCAASPCCAGNIGRDPRFTSRGRSNARGSARRARSASRGTRGRCGAIRPTTCFW